MLINKIKGLKLIKPIEVEVKMSKVYTVDCPELNLHGSGATRKQAIADFVFSVIDLYEDYDISDLDDENGNREKFLAYFE